MAEKKIEFLPLHSTVCVDTRIRGEDMGIVLTHREAFELWLELKKVMDEVSAEANY